jgi:hypothetical protein
VQSLRFGPLATGLARAIAQICHLATGLASACNRRFLSITIFEGHRHQLWREASAAVHRATRLARSITIYEGQQLGRVYRAQRSAHRNLTDCTLATSLAR